MTATEPLEFGTLAALAAMVVATYLMRAGGFWLMGRVPLTARVRLFLEALPGSIVVAVILPLIVKSGGAGILAVGVGGAVMIVLRNDFIAVLAGVAVAALVRAFGM
jgi:uncharacterized membrane protein